jgi:integrase
MKSTFTIPKVCKPANGQWYVYFRYDGQLKRYKLGLNYIHDLTKKQKEFDALAKAIHQKLKNGWNPNTPDIEFSQSDYSFFNALHFALEKKKPNISPKTYSGYLGTVNFICDASICIGIKSLPIREIKRAHIKLFMETAAKKRSWSNKAYNKHLNHLKAILSELIQWDIIEFNPAHAIKNLPVEETEANTPATPWQHKKIKETLEQHHPDFYRFILTIFHTGIRPAEILKIKINMIDLFRQQIIIPKENSKTRRKRIVPINHHLLKHYLELNLEKQPGDYFLFGSHREPQKGNLGNHIDFIPGPTAIKRDTATRRWETIVKKGLGFKEVNLYSNKHAGANAKILAGMPLDVLRELYGHTSILMTEKYAKKIKDVYRKQIMDNSPDF